MLLRYENQKKNQTQIKGCGNNSPPPPPPPPRKVIVEWLLSAGNDISYETIRKSFKSCALTTALVGDEDDQIHCFKPEENPFVAILGDIAEATRTEMLIDEDEEGDEEIDVLL